MSHAYIFVYGTLRRDTNSEMHHLLAEYAEFIGEATRLGKLYEVGRYPGMVLSDNIKDSVHGEVYLLRHEDIVLPLLDQYEEFGPEFPEPNEYRRQRQTVFLGNGDRITAWLYVYNHPVAELKLIKSADFLNPSI